MVKLEISGEPQDKMYETISSYIEGLRYGSDKLNFVRLADKDFQNKMDELAQCFEEELRSELLLVRKKVTRTPILFRRASIFPDL